jgi:hypothetical protein
VIRRDPFFRCQARKVKIEQLLKLFNEVNWLPVPALTKIAVIYGKSRNQLPVTKKQAAPLRRDSTLSSWERLQDR